MFTRQTRDGDETARSAAHNIDRPAESIILFLKQVAPRAMGNNNIYCRRVYFHT